MATRMQQRRGTASQWTSADPILAAGEIGFETDTGEFRVGDGVNHWSDLSPFKNIVDLGGNLDDYVPLTSVGANDGVAPLNSTGQVPSIHLTDITSGFTTALGTLHTTITDETANSLTALHTTISGETADSIEAQQTTTASDYTSKIAIAKDEAISAAETDATTKANTAQANAETTASGYVSTHAADTTDVHGISDTSALATKEGTETFKNKTILAGDNNVTINAADIVDVTSSASELNILDGATLTTSELNHLAGITSNVQGQINGKAPLDNPTFTGTVNAADITLSGNLTVNGTTTTVNTANLAVSDPLIYIGENNSSDTVDLGFVAAFDDGTYQHTGLVRDASDGVWKLFEGVEDEPTTTINFGGAGFAKFQPGALFFGEGTIGDNPIFQEKAGVPSITEIIPSTTNYSVDWTDRDRLIEMNSSSPLTVTIPTNSSIPFPVGTSIDILQTGSGQVTIAGAGGVTVNATPGLKLRTQWSSATLFKRATDTWVVFGDLSA